ncbi:50S ribosomal protein L29 [Candidatus Shapirobacteria bacterium CG09_land_8_20_14_0_10_39_12]|uniref:Large ribosomal subunit protein uL29 n=1 Tax=Candidatus Shapirobacteria bacterium CG09_land_8_20_14_0_10_39_12 TaxID=1974885 RepID=A0A2H0WP75_9BACT|nr:MAG: 50S ribosomal protein L29 [Candidatus Shapirobacteria bacterium CG09_land_8_20_14_0_10_39_12]
MKSKQKQDLRSKTDEELAREIIKSEEEIDKLMLDIRMAKTKNTSLLRRKKDDLAIIKTILQEKIIFKKLTN